MYKIIAAILLIIGIPLWIISIFFMYIIMLMSALGRKIYPSQNYNNCWIYALSQYFYNDGYLIIRKSEGIKVFNLFSIPHIMWANAIPADTKVKQYLPIKRKLAKIMPWFVLWYKGEIITLETPTVGKDSN
jgi:hypothetical protein